MKSHRWRENEKLKAQLEALYGRYNRREYVHPDPLEVLYQFDRLRDREVAGLVAGCLAYGRVSQILKSVSLVLERMTPSPYRFLRDQPAVRLKTCFSDFKHRFATGQQLSAMLIGVKKILGHYGSLQACFMAGFCKDTPSILEALSFFTKEIIAKAGQPLDHMMPLPTKGSACKRLHLFLRWMVREDAVDPGGWNQVPRSALIVPIDAHMHRISLELGFTQRRSANRKTALEITQRFKALAPEDPVKYDFCLTRIGIRKDISLNARDMLR